LALELDHRLLSVMSAQQATLLESLRANIEALEAEVGQQVG
jgi:hypothetical protein